MFFAFAYMAASAVSTLMFYGTMEPLTGGKTPEFTETYGFYMEAYSDVSYVTELLYNQNLDRLEAEIAAAKDSEVEKALGRYLAEKAAIIEGELYYVATHYDRNGDYGEYNYEYGRDESDGYDPYYNYNPATPVIPASTLPVPSASVPESATAVPLPEPESAADTEAPGTAVVPVSTTMPVTEPATSARRPVTVDPYAPANVRLCQEIVSSTEGLGYLQYENLVRSGAFYERYFDFKVEFDLLGNRNRDSYWFSSNLDYSLNQIDARAEFERRYDDGLRNFINSSRENLRIFESFLIGKVNFKYLIVSESENIRLTNLSDRDAATIAAEPRNVTERDSHLVYEQGKIVSNTLEGYRTVHTKLGYSGEAGIELLFSAFDKSADYKIYVYVEDEPVPGDAYYTMRQRYDRVSGQNALQTAVIAAIALLLAVVSLIVLLVLCGHKNGVEGIVPAFIDKLPTDIHTIAAVGGAVLLGVLAMWLFGDKVANEHYAYSYYQYLGGFYGGLRVDKILRGLYLSKLGLALVSLLATAAWALLVEWSASAARTKKAGRSFFKSTLVFLLTRFAARQIRRAYRLFKKFAQVFFYKPRRFKRQTLLAAAGYIILNAALTMLAVLCMAWRSAVGTLLFLALFAALNIFVLYKLLKYIGKLDTIVVASSDYDSMNIDAAGMPQSLALLAANLKVTQEKTRRAVEKAVRDERMRTELITNVSHDLKTPLTAVISYVDLLKKCDITDEDARSYIVVLDEKSIRLKRLIEDLLEASKASSGNVTLNSTSINLIELTTQLVGEMSDAFESAGLGLICDMPAQAPVIYADSQKTYRIIDNLLNNALKYSAPVSRVYMSVFEEGGFGVTMIKNMSREQLNISPDELTERFVRGDMSRTNEGNGLGLSIAKDLCTLQGGRLELQIDGDLFKASVYLPLDSRR